MEANFSLISWVGGEQWAGPGRDPNHEHDLRAKTDDASPQFKFPNRLFKIGIEPVHRGLPGDWDDMERNRKRCLDLESQLAKELDRKEWALTLKFKANLETTMVTKVEDPGIAPGYAFTEEYKGLVSMDISLEGEVMGLVHSLMMYGLPAGVGMPNLKLCGVLTGMGLLDTDIFQMEGLTHSSVFRLHFNEVLRPQLKEDGSLDHCKYVALSAELKDDWLGAQANRMLVDPSVLEPETDYWELEQVNVTIDGTSSEEVDKGCTGDQGGRMEKFKKIVGFGVPPDLTIIGRDGVTFPCYSGVLIAQSPVIAVKMSGRFEEDAKDPTIDMKDRSKEEITAFLEFLYYGGFEKALESPAIAFTLYEMGRYYFVSKLEEAMEALLLTRPSQWFSVGDGLQLWLLAGKYEKGEFKRKAVDVLGIRTDDEIIASDLCPVAFPSGETVGEFMIGRKPF